MEQTTQKKNDGFFALPDNHKPTRCRSCNQDIAFITMPSGAQMPLDLSTKEEREGGWYAQAHFITCPQGRGWSKGNRP